MPLSASAHFIFLGLTKLRADGRTELTAVRMIVKHVLGRANLGAGRIVEAKFADSFN